MTRLLSIIAAVLVLAVGAMGQVYGDCGHWDSTIYGGNTLHETLDSQWHYAGGYHYLDAWRDGTCRYQCPGGGQCDPNTLCIATAEADSTPSSDDTGVLTVIQTVGVWSHVLKTNNASSSYSNQGDAHAQASSALAVAQCPAGLCSLSVKVTAGGVLDFSLVGGFSVWDHPDTFTGYCPAYHAYPQTPIIIDVANEGFQLTDAVNGVSTETVDPGRSIHLAWTQPGSHNAFLYLDGHLFGNSTPQLPSKDCADPTTGCGNGFAALAMHDSNGDGVIDASDPVFSQLRLWIDSNHDGAVQPGELFTLPSMGVESISLRYALDKHTDAFGNLFGYRGHVKAAHGVDRTIYDVSLTIDPTQ